MVCCQAETGPGRAGGADGFRAGGADGFRAGRVGRPRPRASRVRGRGVHALHVAAAVPPATT
jgi:hypothetical protein